MEYQLHKAFLFVPAKEGKIWGSWEALLTQTPSLQLLNLLKFLFEEI